MPLMQSVPVHPNPRSCGCCYGDSMDGGKTHKPGNGLLKHFCMHPLDYRFLGNLERNCACRAAGKVPQQLALAPEKDADAK